MFCPKKSAVFAISVVIFFCVASTARADDITDWNQHMLRATTIAGTSPLVTTRVAAIVQASVFDAVNGIDRKYAPVHVAAAAPAGASRRAAAVQAAYTALVALFLPQKAIFDGRLAVSLTAIAADPHETSAGIAAGIAWGTTVANGILAWRWIYATAASVFGWNRCGTMAAHATCVRTWSRPAICHHGALGDQCAFSISSGRPAGFDQRPLRN